MISRRHLVCDCAVSRNGFRLPQLGGCHGSVRMSVGEILVARWNGGFLYLCWGVDPHPAVDAFVYQFVFESAEWSMALHAVAFHFGDYQEF